MANILLSERQIKLIIDQIQKSKPEQKKVKDGLLNYMSEIFGGELKSNKNIQNKKI
jgi:hypothetical protein